MTTDDLGHQKMSEPTDNVFQEVAAEREKQDTKWGGTTHDDTHSANDWRNYLREHIKKSRSEDYRYQMIRVAALAIAAIESFDRKEAAKMNAGTPPQEHESDCKCDCVNCVTGNHHQCYYNAAAPAAKEPVTPPQVKNTAQLFHTVLDECLLEELIVHDGLTGSSPVSLFGILYHQTNATTGTWLNLNRASWSPQGSSLLMANRFFCDRCDRELPYSCHSAHGGVFHEKKDLSFSVQFVVHIIGHTRGTWEICEDCVIELASKALTDKSC